MRVKELCTREARSCTPESNLADAAWSMWEADCGVLPVIDAAGKVIGVITDRDISMAVATKHRPAREIGVREVVTGKLFSCALNDDVKDALKVMRSNKVRRLPVVDPESKLQGVLSLNDVAVAAKPDRGGKAGEITYEDVAVTLQAICEHRAHSEKLGALVPEEKAK